MKTDDGMKAKDIKTKEDGTKTMDESTKSPNDIATQLHDRSSEQYDDIIDIPHPTSSRHPRMSMMTRAAQFAPFAALSGYEEAIEELVLNY